MSSGAATAIGGAAWASSRRRVFNGEFCTTPRDREFSLPLFSISQRYILTCNGLVQAQVRQQRMCTRAHGSLSRILRWMGWEGTRKEDEELSGAPAVPSPDSSLTSNRCPTHPLFVQCVPDFCRGLNPHGRSNRRVIYRWWQVVRWHRQF